MDWDWGLLNERTHIINENTLDAQWRDEAYMLRQILKLRDAEIASLKTQNDTMRKQLQIMMNSDSQDKKLLAELTSFIADRYTVPESRL